VKSIHVYVTLYIGSRVLRAFFKIAAFFKIFWLLKVLAPFKS